MARPDNLSSLDGIIAALYDSISGPAGRERDLARLRSLFLPGAGRLIRTEPTEAGGARAHVFTPEEFHAQASAYFAEHGFYEREVARRVEQFGNVAHAMSTYESRHDEADAEPFSRGVNSIQLLRDGARWWVVSLFWDFERPDNPLPPEYLPRA